MSKALITESYLEDIADSIRTKLGVQTQYLPSEMSAAIDSISGGGGGIITQPLSVTENGTYTAPIGYAYTPVTVNVSGGGGSVSPLLDREIKQDSGTTRTLDETVTIPENGDYYVFAFGYTTATDVYINSVQQTNDYDYSTDYIHAYAKKVTLSKDDTVRLNMYGSGHVYIRAFIAKEVSGGGTLIADWDFTTSLIDTVSGLTATLTTDASQDSSGVSITGTKGAIQVNGGLKASTRTYEIKIGDMTLDTLSRHHRFFMPVYNSGLIYRSNGYWSFYYGSWATDSDIDDYDYFANSTMKIVVDVNGNWHIYKDDTLVYEPNITYDIRTTSGVLMIGSSDAQSCTGVVIEGLTVY